MAGVDVSIVMPFWGDFGHLREAVDSVRCQTDPNWQLVVVDDVYPDEAPGQWVKGLGDERITYVRNEENLGPSRNYTRAVNLVDSEHVVIMGCDDRMLPGYLTRVRELLAQWPGVDLIQPGVRVIDENGVPSNPLPDRIKRLIQPKASGPIVLEGEDAAVSLLRGNWTYFPSLVWRRGHVVNGFRPDLNVVQDLAKIMEILFAGGSLVVDDQVEFEYRRHSSSVSARTAVDGSKYGQEMTLFRETVYRAREMGWDEAARAASRHWTSRASALASVPAAIAARHRDGQRALLSHAFGRTRPIAP